MKVTTCKVTDNKVTDELRDSEVIGLDSVEKI